MVLLQVLTIHESCVQPLKNSEWKPEDECSYSLIVWPSFYSSWQTLRRCGSTNVWAHHGSIIHAFYFCFIILTWKTCHSWLKNIVIFTSLTRCNLSAPITGNAQKFMFRELVLVTCMLIWSLFCNAINNLVDCSFMKKRRIVRSLEKNLVSL
jgi:hypothetical protein